MSVLTDWQFWAALVVAFGLVVSPVWVRSWVLTAIFSATFIYAGSWFYLVLALVSGWNSTRAEKS